ncbi:MAG: hypothetical protein R3F11_03890 [Verrucomicrobiales bacterium]
MPRDPPPPRLLRQWLAPAAAAITSGSAPPCPGSGAAGEGEMTSDQLAAADEEADKLAMEGDGSKT